MRFIIETTVLAVAAADGRAASVCGNDVVGKAGVEGPFNSLSGTHGKQTPLTLIEAVQPMLCLQPCQTTAVHALFNNIT
jgi:hypothetical protein